MIAARSVALALDFRFVGHDFQAAQFFWGFASEAAAKRPPHWRNPPRRTFPRTRFLLVVLALPAALIVLVVVPVLAAVAVLAVLAAVAVLAVLAALAVLAITAAHICARFACCARCAR